MVKNVSEIKEILVSDLYFLQASLSYRAQKVFSSHFASTYSNSNFHWE